MALPNFPLKLANGKNYNLKDYDDYVILIVNTATECGLAPQFRDLEKLYQKYKDKKFVVLGFPSNQFKQENTSNYDMTDVCNMYFKVTFPLNEKIFINGNNASPLFLWLKDQKYSFGKRIKWNFTKFLIDRKGQVVHRFSPITSPLKLENQIKKLL